MHFFPAGQGLHASIAVCWPRELYVSEGQSILFTEPTGHQLPAGHGIPAPEPSGQ